ncbi:MAG: tetratricopeptide repeat protein [Planctomycetota bacterium]|nr:tetratricopeptide repeat protein [Planctomycetota bacterium]
MNCDEARVLLEETGPRSRDAAVAEHLAGCQDCGRYAAGLEGENALLQQGLATPPDEARWQRVQAALAARLARHAAARVRARRLWWTLASAAAMALISVAAWLAFNGPASREEAAIAKEIAHLQKEVRDKQVLDELEQLQIVFHESGDAEGKSAAEDAELYLERILALDAKHAEQSREVLAGIRAAGIHQRLRQVRESIADDAPAPLRASLDLATSTLGAATVLCPTPLPAPQPQDAFAAADWEFGNGAYENALAAYHAVAERSAGDWRTAQARFTAAFILQKKLGRAAQAREAYENVIKYHASSPLARHAQFHIAEVEEQSGDPQTAIKEYKQYLKRAARSARAPGVNRKLEFLDRKAQGLAAEPPGWAQTVERKHWRKSQNLPLDPGEKRPRVRNAPARSAEPGLTPQAPPAPPAPAPDAEAPTAR